MPHCPVTVVQRYRDGVCSLLFHLFFIICHPYIPLHLIFILVSPIFDCAKCTIKNNARIVGAKKEMLIPRYAAHGDRTRTAPLRPYATNLYAALTCHKPRIVHTLYTLNFITRVRAGEGVAHYPKWRRSLLIRAETRDFHSRREMGARTIAWCRCTPLTIVDQFGIKIRGFTLPARR